MVEGNAELIIESAKKHNTAFLVVGDPFGYLLCAILQF